MGKGQQHCDSARASKFSGSALKLHQQTRHPVIIYTHSPKIIHIHKHDFKSLVQKLTGISRSREIFQDGALKQPLDSDIKKCRRSGEDAMQGQSLLYASTQSFYGIDSMMYGDCCSNDGIGNSISPMSTLDFVNEFQDS